MSLLAHVVLLYILKVGPFPQDSFCYKIIVTNMQSRIFSVNRVMIKIQKTFFYNYKMLPVDGPCLQCGILVQSTT